MNENLSYELVIFGHSGRASDAGIVHGGVVSRTDKVEYGVEQFLPDTDFESELAQIFATNSPNGKGVYVQYSCGRDRDNRDQNREKMAQQMNATIYGTKDLISTGFETDGMFDVSKGQYSPSPGKKLARITQLAEFTMTCR